jgi:DNA-binding transcriptional ArsR family regulator
MGSDFATTGILLGDRTRATMLLGLMGGIALPAGELARIANVAPQTASEHLTKLVNGRLLTVERQGRHRYYRLSSTQVADALEALLVLTTRPRVGDRNPDKGAMSAGTLAHARTCYAHLAGWLGVHVAESLQERALLTPHDAKTYTVTASGRAWFDTLGITLPASDLAQQKAARRCLDWTERRHHLAGALGCAMYRRFCELEWLAPVRDTRAVRVTLLGKQCLWDLLRIPIRG